MYKFELENTNSLIVTGAYGNFTQFATTHGGPSLFWSNPIQVVIKVADSEKETGMG